MSLSFTGPKGWLEQRWIFYALLRDNVQHHLESGSPSSDFECLHSISTVLGGATVTFPARRFNAELTRAREALIKRPIGDLAISVRTQSVLGLGQPVPSRRGTKLVTAWGGTIPTIGSTAKTLDDVFGHLIDGLLEITADAAEDELVTVNDL